MAEPLTYDDVREAFDTGSVVTASKERLEQLLLAVGRARVLSDANRGRAAEMGETMRLLLAARQSEGMHNEALRVARVALWLSAAAFAISILQGLATFNVISPLAKPIVTLPQTK